eukprot:scpid101476/ scgid19670/ 
MVRHRITNSGYGSCGRWLRRRLGSRGAVSALVLLRRETIPTLSALLHAFAPNAGAVAVAPATSGTLHRLVCRRGTLELENPLKTTELEKRVPTSTYFVFMSKLYKF